ncbi:hypothetical protein SLEP1_g50445 [Rubroshorea leprosula]|uniref:Aminotransferase-like plant mobile domain-containing protein n=1 Tax=Rubroshorea leprosula TaxID=152421 RepID=A0AAV5M095_9ROSI|nr:hypothetical protein SLEP1_g50445 [Rubroshorea leprosula]
MMAFCNSTLVWRKGRRKPCGQGLKDETCCQFQFTLPSRPVRWKIGSGWAKEMLVRNSFVETLHAARILKSIALSQTLQISGNVECLRRLVRRWCMSTHTFILAFGEITVALEDVTNLMLLPIVGEEDPRHIVLTPEECATLIALRNASASSRSLRGKYNIDFPTWMQHEAPFSPVDARFCPYHSGYVTNGKVLKEYPMAKCGYTSETTPLACSWMGQRKIKGQKIPKVDGLLDDYGSFNFHAYKTMPGTCSTRDWNKAMRPYIDEAATAMWSEGVATLSKHSWGFLSREDNGQWIPICFPILGMVEEEYDQASAIDEEIRQKASGDVEAREGADEAAPPRRLVLGKTKSVAHLPKSRARRTSASPTSKQSKAKAPTPSKAKTTKEKDTSHDSENNESSWGNPDPKVIKRIKRLRPIRGDRCLASNEGFGPIPIPGDDKVPSKAKEAKQEEALVNPEVRRKILASETSEPLLPNDILNVVDSIIDWSDPISFTAASVEKAKASKVPPQKPTMVSYGTPNTTKKPEIVKTQLEVMVLKLRPISELPPFRAGDFELALGGFIPTRKIGASINEKDVEKGEAKAMMGIGKERGKKKSISNKGKTNTGAPAMSSVKKVADPGEIKHNGQSSVAPTKSSEIDDSAMRLLNNLDKMNEDKDVSLAQFGLVPLGGSRAVGKFAVSAMLEPRACHLLDIFPNLMTCSKAKKVVVEDAFSILCATMQHIEVTPFVEMNKDFFYLCRDALDDAESINFEVNTLRTHLSNLAKAYLGKTEFDATRGDMVEGLDERIKEQVKHIEEMEKSLAETKELVVKLEERLVSAKVYLGLLNQEKECLDSNGVTELRHAYMEAAKAFGNELDPFLP